MFKESKEIKFWLPTTEYFIELPLRMQEATVVGYTGEMTHGGRRYDLVFVSWGSAEPQKTVDQYLLWIDHETSLLAFVQFTVRDQGKFFKGGMEYGNYHDLDGVKVPFSLATKDNLGGDGGPHAFTIHEVHFKPDIDEKLIIPDPSQRSGK